MPHHLEPWVAWKGKLVVGSHTIGETTITSHGLQYIPPLGRQLVMSATGRAEAVMSAVMSPHGPLQLSLHHPTPLARLTVTVTTLCAASSSNTAYNSFNRTLSNSSLPRVVCGQLWGAGGVRTEVLLLPQCPTARAWGLVSAPSGGGDTLYLLFVSTGTPQQMVVSVAMLREPMRNSADEAEDAQWLPDIETPSMRLSKAVHKAPIVKSMLIVKSKGKLSSNVESGKKSPCPSDQNPQKLKKTCKYSKDQSSSNQSADSSKDSGVICHRSSSSVTSNEKNAIICKPSTASETVSQQLDKISVKYDSSHAGGRPKKSHHGAGHLSPSNNSRQEDGPVPKRYKHDCRADALEYRHQETLDSIEKSVPKETQSDKNTTHAKDTDNSSDSVKAQIHSISHNIEDKKKIVLGNRIEESHSRHESSTLNTEGSRYVKDNINHEESEKDSSKSEFNHQCPKNFYEDKATHSNKDLVENESSLDQNGCRRIAKETRSKDCSETHKSRDKNKSAEVCSRVRSSNVNATHYDDRDNQINSNGHDRKRDKCPTDSSSHHRQGSSSKYYRENMNQNKTSLKDSTSHACTEKASHRTKLGKDDDKQIESCNKNISSEPRTSIKHHKKKMEEESVSRENSVDYVKDRDHRKNITSAKSYSDKYEKDKIMHYVTKSGEYCKDSKKKYSSGSRSSEHRSRTSRDHKLSYEKYSRKTSTVSGELHSTSAESNSDEKLKITPDNRTLNNNIEGRSKFVDKISTYNKIKSATNAADRLSKSRDHSSSLTDKLHKNVSVGAHKNDSDYSKSKPKIDGKKKEKTLVENAENEISCGDDSKLANIKYSRERRGKSKTKSYEVLSNRTNKTKMTRIQYPVCHNEIKEIPLLDASLCTVPTEKRQLSCCHEKRSKFPKCDCTINEDEKASNGSTKNVQCSDSKNMKIPSSLQSKLPQCHSTAKTVSSRYSLLKNSDKSNTEEVLSDLRENKELRNILESFGPRIDLRTVESLEKALNEMNIPNQEISSFKKKILTIVSLLSPEIKLNRMGSMFGNNKCQKNHVEFQNMKNQSHVPLKNKSKVSENTNTVINACMEVKEEKVKEETEDSNEVYKMKSKSGDIFEKCSGKRKDEQDSSDVLDTNRAKKTKIDSKLNVNIVPRVIDSLNNAAFFSKVTIGDVVVDQLTKTEDICKYPSNLNSFTFGQETTESGRFGDIDSSLDQSLLYKSSSTKGVNLSEILTSKGLVQNSECNVNPNVIISSHDQKEPLDLSARGDQTNSHISGPSASLNSSTKYFDQFEDVVECNLPCSQVEKHYLLDKFLEAMDGQNSTESVCVDDSYNTESVLRDISRSTVEHSNISVLSKSLLSLNNEAVSSSRTQNISSLDPSVLEATDGLLALQSSAPLLPNQVTSNSLEIKEMLRKFTGAGDVSSLHPTQCHRPLDNVKVKQFTPPTVLPMKDSVSKSSDHTAIPISSNDTANVGSENLSNSNACNTAEADSFEKEQFGLSTFLNYMKEMDRNIMAQQLALQRKDKSIQQGLRYLSSLMKRRQIEAENLNPCTTSVDLYILRQLEKLHGVLKPTSTDKILHKPLTQSQNRIMSDVMMIVCDNNFPAKDNCVSGINFNFPSHNLSNVQWSTPVQSTDTRTQSAQTSTSAPAQQTDNNPDTLSGCNFPGDSIPQSSDGTPLFSPPTPPGVCCKPPIHPNTSSHQELLLQGITHELARWNSKTLDCLPAVVREYDTPVTKEQMATSKYASIYMPTAEERIQFKRLLVSSPLLYTPVSSLLVQGGHLLVRSSALPALLQHRAITRLMARSAVSIYTFPSQASLQYCRGLTARLRLGCLLLLHYTAMLDPQLGPLLAKMVQENKQVSPSYNTVVIGKPTLRKCLTASLKQQQPCSSQESKAVAVLMGNLEQLRSGVGAGLVQVVEGVTDSTLHLPTLHRALLYLHKGVALLTGRRVPNASPSTESGAFYRTVTLAMLCPEPFLEEITAEQEQAIPVVTLESTSSGQTTCEPPQQHQQLQPLQLSESAVITPNEPSAQYARSNVQSPSISSCIDLSPNDQESVEKTPRGGQQSPVVSGPLSYSSPKVFPLAKCSPAAFAASSAQPAVFPLPARSPQASTCSQGAAASGGTGNCGQLISSPAGSVSTAQRGSASCVAEQCPESVASWEPFTNIKPEASDEASVVPLISALEVEDTVLFEIKNEHQPPVASLLLSDSVRQHEVVVDDTTTTATKSS